MADRPDAQRITQVARSMRRDINEMVTAAGSGHPGGSLSATDIVATLFFGVMRHDPQRPDWAERDRFVLSKGHAAPVLYAALAEAGYFGREHLRTLRKLGSILQGHPDRLKTPGVEVSTGSLGQGLAVANGMALGLRIDGIDSAQVFCVLGDGELQEGSVWEAVMSAHQWRLGNLVAVVDANGLQIDGPCSEIVCPGDIAADFRAFGWKTLKVDGHDVEALIDAFEEARTTTDGPVAIVCRTVKGKGVSFMEGEVGWHGKAPSAEQAEQALAELA
jgi:transketolase